MSPSKHETVLGMGMSAAAALCWDRCVSAQPWAPTMGRCCLHSPGGVTSHQHLPKTRTSSRRHTLAHHLCGSWSFQCPPGYPGPFLLSCSPGGWHLAYTDAFPQVQGFALLFGKLPRLLSAYFSCLLMSLWKAARPSDVSATSTSFV